MFLLKRLRRETRMRMLALDLLYMLFYPFAMMIAFPQDMPITDEKTLLIATTMIIPSMTAIWLGMSLELDGENKLKDE